VVTRWSLRGGLTSQKKDEWLARQHPIAISSHKGLQTSLAKLPWGHDTRGDGADRRANEADGASKHLPRPSLRFGAHLLVGSRWTRHLPACMTVRAGDSTTPEVGATAMPHTILEAQPGTSLPPKERRGRGTRNDTLCMSWSQISTSAAVTECNDP